ncbi:DUF2254 domain-containing protein [Croceicoccus ponticola]|uniref:DUF2254 domain-containing protein n=1 Tax=Croceicoccus ponticola TaxID=2217664 RepID=A0A437GX76_9SPHN|nr:DUF2254 domain-containing protein [Croceicoccus ponticola]RVQ66993.1 DUF2254 domain-containing protein [Croceicoccus ponticola]
MTARLLPLWNRINASYWFWPATFCVLAFALSLFTIHLDRSGAAEWLSANSAIAPARPGGANTMLQVIAGSMIGVAATVFSITIAAVAYASGTYGPRLLTNFMEDRGNQLSLATFIGTFLYATMVLRVVRGEDERATTIRDALSSDLPGFVPQLSLLVATGLMLVSIGVLVFFLNHIPSSIRINKVLEQIGRRLIEQVRDRFPTESVAITRVERPQGSPVIARDSGYIEVIDFAGLEAIAARHDGQIVLLREAGDFVHPAMPLAQFCGGKADDSDPDEVDTAEKRADDMRGCFVVSGLRTPQQDLRFLIDELVEIALRALSPGINDPFTAMTALHWLGAATAELGQRELRVSPTDVDKQDKSRVFPLHSDFADYVATGFGSARSAVASSRKATLALFDSLYNCAISVRGADRMAVLAQEADRLMDQCAGALTGPDLVEVHERHRTFQRDVARIAAA